MEPIIIMGVDGPRVRGTKWIIREGQADLDQADTRKQAEQRARNKWAAPGQAIRLVNTKGHTKTLRQANPSKQPPSQPSGGDSGLFGL